MAKSTMTRTFTTFRDPSDTTNQKFQIVSFFSYLGPKGFDYLSPTLFDTSSIYYLTPHPIWHQCLLFGPKSSYLALPSSTHRCSSFPCSCSTPSLYHFLRTPSLVQFLRRMYYISGLHLSYLAPGTSSISLLFDLCVHCTYYYPLPVF
jgi:hypothetical protein